MEANLTFNETLTVEQFKAQMNVSRIDVKQNPKTNKLFFTFGAKGWFGGDAADVGPKSGFGFFYHLTDSLSLRFDADATLGLDGKQKMRYTLTGGVQWSF